MPISLEYIIIFILLIIILVFVYLIVWWNLRQQKLKIKKLIRQQRKAREKAKKENERLENVNKELVSNIEKLESIEEKLKQEEARLLRKEELFTYQLEISSQKEREIQVEEERVRKIKKQLIGELEEKSSISKDEAKKILLSLIKEEITDDLNKYKEEKIKQAEDNIKEESTKIICLALEKYSSELISTTTNSLSVENRQIISKIIGKEGRNINAFRRITGTEVIIEEEGENPTVQISSFNTWRREVASQVLTSLLKQERISPSQIEKTYQQVIAEKNFLIIETGEETLKELQLKRVHPELIKYLGKLKYRTSYGQNVLQHCLEVAKLSGIIASELGLDVFLARRAGLFHDIGKAIEDNGTSHVFTGISLAKKYKEPAVVINAIASHHRDFPADNFYSLIVLAADTLSAARPGVRGYQLESYVERINDLENLAQEFPGIKKVYAFQAGREVWVIADAEELNDYQTWEISRQIRTKIQENIAIPGEVTVNVIREKRFVQKLRSNIPQNEPKE